jgi:hypothetical protein
MQPRSRQVPGSQRGLGRVHARQKTQLGRQLSGCFEGCASFLVAPELEQGRAFIECHGARGRWNRAGPRRRKCGQRFLVPAGAKVGQPEHEVSGSPTRLHGDDFASSRGRGFEISGGQRGARIVKKVPGWLVSPARRWQTGQRGNQAASYRKPARESAASPAGRRWGQGWPW